MNYENAPVTRLYIAFQEICIHFTPWNRGLFLNIKMDLLLYMYMWNYTLQNIMPFSECETAIYQTWKTQWKKPQSHYKRCSSLWIFDIVRSFYSICLYDVDHYTYILYVYIYIWCRSSHMRYNSCVTYRNYIETDLTQHLPFPLYPALSPLFCRVLPLSGAVLQNAALSALQWALFLWCRCVV